MMLIEVWMTTADVSRSVRLIAECDNSTPSYIKGAHAAVARRPVHVTIATLVIRYDKARSAVIFRQNDVGGRARAATHIASTLRTLNRYVVMKVWGLGCENFVISEMNLGLGRFWARSAQ